MSKKPEKDRGYRPCVGAMVLNAEGKVLVGKRLTSGNSASDLLWQMPQGGIDKGEKPYAAALRELFEETSISSVTLLAESEDWLTYDFPAGFRRKGFSGQKQMWFVFRFDGAESEINVLCPADGAFHAEFSDWRWVDMSELPDLIVPFKRDVYVQLVELFGHLS